MGPPGSWSLRSLQSIIAAHPGRLTDCCPICCTIGLGITCQSPLCSLPLLEAAVLQRRSQTTARCRKFCRSLTLATTPTVHRALVIRVSSCHNSRRTLALQHRCPSQPGSEEHATAEPSHQMTALSCSIGHPLQGKLQCVPVRGLCLGYFSLPGYPCTAPCLRVDHTALRASMQISV